MKAPSGRESLCFQKVLGRAVSLLILICMMPCGVGCGSSSKYPTAQVSGIVTLDNEPLSGAIVNFQPVGGDNPNVGPGSTGRADENGHFSLTTIHDDPGAVVGTHKVRIYSYSPESAPAGDGDAGPIVERVPHRYNYRSQLTFSVPAEGTKEADFKLTLP